MTFLTPDAATAAAAATASAVVGTTAVGGGVSTAIEADTEAPPEDLTAAAAVGVEQAAATDGTVTQTAVQHQRKRTNQRHTLHKDPSAASSQFNQRYLQGQLVWAKHGKHPHWPARISSVLDEQSVEVEFFPDETAGLAEVRPAK